MKVRRRALISVSDKAGVIEFAKGLATLDFEIVSTGGTMTKLAEGGVFARQVSDVTGVPEILGGRVKTLHSSIFAGILAQRQLSEDMDTLANLEIAPVDVVAVNLYPFERTAARPGAAFHEIIEQIDIGGPSLLRAAAKNHADVYAVVDPNDYDELLRVLADGRDAEAAEFRRRLAGKVFRHCSAYDHAIAAFFGGVRAETETETVSPLPAVLKIEWPRTQSMRYGENPHQPAAFYADPEARPPSLAHCRQLQGKELSYNNFLDGEAALEMPREFEEPVATILKHANPCGVGRGDTPETAFKAALECDPVSAFGGIVGFNRPVDGAAAEAMKDIFLEVVIAPGFEDDALKIFAKKKNLRLLESGALRPRDPSLVMRSISGGVLVQTADVMPPHREAMTVVTKAQPTLEDWDALLFGWKVVRWVRSNAVVYCDARRTVGIGAGQMSRIDAARFGIDKAGGRIDGACVASDAFFPFRDVVDLVAKAGARAIVQPGGSLRDDESIAAANEHGLVMIFTGQRHFRH